MNDDGKHRNQVGPGKTEQSNVIAGGTQYENSSHGRISIHEKPSPRDSLAGT